MDRTKYFLSTHMTRAPLKIEPDSISVATQACIPTDFYPLDHRTSASGISIRWLFNPLKGRLFKLVDKLFHSALGWLIHHQGFQAVFLPANPPHDSTSHKEAYLVRHVDGQETCLPYSQPDIAGETPPVH